ncbi:PREDICTED: myosin-11 isoform X2 [Tarenaya hassleriana]|uniref:myosin-11 isoform X2 n=1 Tax=Tarenaya hassleriana TaxID=28532 RepID=UPI00053C3C98|nr:PREDICTED: myosin-11 isoform X2 [Tarenaya hassleriana]
MASMAVEVDEKKITSAATKRSPDANDAVSGNNNPNDASPPQPKVSLNPKDFIISVASNIASQPLQNYEPNVWGVLTAISSNARKRRQQGINILLTCDEHCIGRMVGDASFRIESGSVSANHCRIYRKNVMSNDQADSSSCMVSVFLKDTSTNGTYLNWERLRKNNSGVRIQHGDIISLASPPEHDMAFAFVYREVLVSNPMLESVNRKRKTEDFACESKRPKGIGIGGPDGPISLDDFKSLQRSNTDLRKQLEVHVLTIDTLRSESRAIVEHHENEIKEIKETVAKSFQDELSELRNLLDAKQKELAQVCKLSAEQKHSMDDLGERLSASMQSFSEANEIIKSQKAAIIELKTQLDDERDQRREERENAAAEVKAVIHKCQTEAQEELKRFSDAAVRREREQQEVINKLKESERERSLQVETVMSKLEDTRQKLVFTDNRVRQLEAQVSEEQLASANARKRVEELELEMKRLQKVLESEKAAREEAWAKVSALELEISAAMRDLDVERQRLRGARERIMLRETQLRAFYSTTAEISILFAKQQEQLKAMQRTLEDEENCDNTSVDIDLNPVTRNANTAGTEENERATWHANGAAKASSSTSGQRFNRNETVDTSTEDAGATEKHDCEIMSQEGQNTQEAEYTSTERIAKGGFGSDIEGVGTAPILDSDVVGTEQVNETQSPGNDYERNVNLSKSNILSGDAVQMDYETQAHESGQHDHPVPLLPLRSRADDQMDMEDTEGVGTIRTVDLLASEVAGSWACSTTPSVHGENETQRSREDGESQTQRVKEVAILHDSAGLVAESQSKPSSSEVVAVVGRKDNGRRALSEMIGIVAPDLKDQFVHTGNDQGKGECDSVSDSDTKSCSDSDDDGDADDRGKEKHGSVSDTDNNEALQSSDSETEGSDGVVREVDTMDEDDGAT